MKTQEIIIVLEEVFNEDANLYFNEFILATLDEEVAKKEVKKCSTRKYFDEWCKKFDIKKTICPPPKGKYVFKTFLI
jgi:hypothetical protein